MNPRIAAPAMQFQMNAGILAAALDGLSDDLFARRVAPGINSIQWLATHLVCARCAAASAVGGTVESPWNELAAGPKTSMRDGAPYPSKAEFQKVWSEATAQLNAGLAAAGDELLDRVVPVPVPLDNPRVDRVLTLLAMHESYHVGQIGLLRKQLGAGPVKLF